MPAGAPGSDPQIAGIADAAWHDLLAFVGQGRPDAGAAYEDLRRRLQCFFEWKSCAAAQELADETLNRVAAKLAAGEKIQTEDPRRYAFGIARFVYLEAARRNARQVTDDGEYAAPGEGDTIQRERRLAALELCLGKLPDKTQQILLRYHESDGRGRIDGRKRLADELGIALNALRIRAHRIRAQIEDCVRTRLAQSDAPRGRP